MQLSQGCQSVRARLARRPLAVAAAVVLPLALAGGGALAAQAAFGSTGPASGAFRLTADTPAPCNRPQPPGFARCFAIVRTPASHVITPDTSGPPPSALGPADIQSAYKLPSATVGGGQTVAVVDAGDDPTAEQDLAVFRSQYGLPPCTTANGCFKKVNQSGQQGNYPPDQGWGLEISLDLDAVSAACPNCNILLVEANTAFVTDLGPAVDEAVTLGATAVSNSYGNSEYSGELSDDQYYNHPGVAVTASAGDSGYGTNWPSASQYVTAVGGSTLTKDTGVTRGWDETVWGSASGGEGTGSGCSPYEPEPSDQNGVTTGCANRATADVSADADPASGLAVYDTDGEGGWLQVGGTSLASPLIAATYALAGSPVSGTYPNSYPYHDPHQASDVFDVTSGANGTCTPAALCTAGAGWDGPTGLGTPDGVKAFQGAPQGQVSGQVTDKATGKLVAGATVTAQPGEYVTRTGASGNYNLTLAAGSYTLTTADFGYQSADTGVTVTANQTSTENFALTAAPAGVLSGTVTDGSGHGWPLHAQLTVSGDPNGPVWTSPYTGKYRVPLPQGSYTLGVSTDYPGYPDKTVPVTVGAGTITANITLDADRTTCSAPGYGPEALTQDFAGWTGSTPRAGWMVSDGGPARPGWRFDNPGNVTPPPSGSLPNSIDPRYHVFTSFDSDHFAVADAGFYNSRPLHTTLTSPPVSVAGQSKPELAFDSAYYPDYPDVSGSAGTAQPAPGGRSPSASVQLSTDTGKTWATLWHQTTSNALGPIVIPIPQAVGKPDVEARWTFTGGGFGHWAVGDVLIGTPGCIARPGGLIAGVVTDHATRKPVNGAQAASTVLTPPYPWPEGIALATADPALPGGFYWLFTPPGRQRLTVTAPGYAAAAAIVTVRPSQVTRQDWALTPNAGSRP